MDVNARRNIPGITGTTGAKLHKYLKYKNHLTKRSGIVDAVGGIDQNNQVENKKMHLPCRY